MLRWFVESTSLLSNGISVPNPGARQHVMCDWRLLVIIWPVPLTICWRPLDLLREEEVCAEPFIVYEAAEHGHTTWSWLQDESAGNEQVNQRFILLCQCEMSLFIRLLCWAVRLRSPFVWFIHRGGITWSAGLQRILHAGWLTASTPTSTGQGPDTQWSWLNTQVINHFNYLQLTFLWGCNVSGNILSAELFFSFQQETTGLFHNAHLMVAW